MYSQGLLPDWVCKSTFQSSSCYSRTGLNRQHHVTCCTKNNKLQHTLLQSFETAKLWFLKPIEHKGQARVKDSREAVKSLHLISAPQLH